MRNKLDILSIHLYWKKKGFSFDNIISIYDEITDANPFSYIGLSDIQKHISGSERFPDSDILTDADYEKITYIFYNEHGFDGNLDFIERCINIEEIQIGCACIGKIENLKPIKNLKKLKHIDLHRHNISDLSPLSNLTNLETLILWGNPIKTIEPIVHFKNLKKIKLSVVEDNEILELLKNSVGADVSYNSTDSQDYNFL